MVIVTAVQTWHTCPGLTFIVMPDVDFPDAAQALLRRNLKNIKAVAVESVLPIQMPVTAFIIHAIQGDPHVGGGTWQELTGRFSSADPIQYRVLSPNPMTK